MIPVKDMSAQLNFKEIDEKLKKLKKLNDNIDAGKIKSGIARFTPTAGAGATGWVIDDGTNDRIAGGDIGGKAWGSGTLPPGTWGVWASGAGLYLGTYPRVLFTGLVHDSVIDVMASVPAGSIHNTSMTIMLPLDVEDVTLFDGRELHMLVGVKRIGVSCGFDPLTVMQWQVWPRIYALRKSDSQLVWLDMPHTIDHDAYEYEGFYIVVGADWQNTRTGGYTGFNMFFSSEVMLYTIEPNSELVSRRITL